MSCIGTAGHVDHGKSALVEVLTGIDPDRLAEEKERGMTIDLGFAWLTLPGGREVSIVDVPGHESFIKNMLAGVGGIDAALLVVAADEGIMPQTREHLAILDLLHVQRGVVALTKADLVDEEWLALVKDEIEEQLRPTVLNGIPILPVSAHTGYGLPELLAVLNRILDESPERQDIARPRLAIDRVFSMTGFGTVVTGTLLDGVFKTGQEVEILPQGIKTRIRNLQTHKQQVNVARPGSRVAINLANVARSDVRRGDIVALPGHLRPTMLIDARIRLLADAERPLEHMMQVDFYSGSQVIPAHVRLLEGTEVLPGESAWAQLRLSRPAVLARRDYFILRVPSPSMTIGGGEILDVHPRYHRRSQASVLLALERLAQGTPDELVLAALDRRPPGAGSSTKTAKASRSLTGYDLKDITRQCNLAEDVTLHILETLLSEGRVRKIGTTWFAQPVWEALVEEAIELVRAQHRNYPLRSGLSKEEWRTKLNLSPKLAAEIFAVLQAEGQLETVTDVGAGSIHPAMYDKENENARETFGRASGLIRLPGFTPTFTPVQQRQVEQLLRRFQESQFTPPGRAEIESIADSEVVGALIEQGRLVKLADGVIFLRSTYEEALARLIAYLHEHGTLTVAEARDVLGATRKYILPLLEHMDAIHITRRAGDERILESTMLHTPSTIQET